MNHFRSLFSQLKFNPALGLFLILLFGVPRFAAVLWTNQGGDYRYVALLFVAMWLLPYILLNKSGREEIGLKKPAKNLWIYLALPLGILLSTFVWWAGDRLYGSEISNWYVYISQSYDLPASFSGVQEYFMYFLIFAGTSMVFSPIGEEILYRGFIHRCFSEKYGDKKAAYIDNWAFALTHLAHFGIIYQVGQWEILWIPALVWVALMSRAARLFSTCRRGSDSVWTAVIAHAGFNLAMTYFIFYHILTPVS